MRYIAFGSDSFSGMENLLRGFREDFSSKTSSKDEKSFLSDEDFEHFFVMCNAMLHLRFLNIIYLIKILF